LPAAGVGEGLLDDLVEHHVRHHAVELMALLAQLADGLAYTWLIWNLPSSKNVPALNCS
jgi:hypothetical protein